jgi:hypothetical protein
VHPTQFGGLRGNDETGVEKPQIMAVPRPAHQPVRPENDRLPIEILASMGDAEDGQEKLDGRVAAIEYIVRDISRGRVQIPVRAQ